MKNESGKGLETEARKKNNKENDENKMAPSDKNTRNLPSPRFHGIRNPKKIKQDKTKINPGKSNRLINDRKSYPEKKKISVIQSPNIPNHHPLLSLTCLRIHATSYFPFSPRFRYARERMLKIMAAGERELATGERLNLITYRESRTAGARVLIRGI